jgi:hypothetical protein
MKKSVAPPAMVVLAIASLTATSSARQGPPTSPPAGDDGKREYAISGCLLRSGYAGYQIEDAHLDAIDGKPVAEPAPASSGNSVTPKKWILEGGGNLAARTGEKVQVIGRSEWQPPSSSAAADEPPNRTPHLDVKSVKPIASSCS